MHPYACLRSLCQPHSIDASPKKACQGQTSSPSSPTSIEGVLPRRDSITEQDAARMFRTANSDDQEELNDRAPEIVVFKVGLDERWQLQWRETPRQHVVIDVQRLQSAQAVGQPTSISGWPTKLRRNAGNGVELSWSAECQLPNPPQSVSSHGHRAEILTMQAAGSSSPQKASERTVCHHCDCWALMCGQPLRMHTCTVLTISGGRVPVNWLLPSAMVKADDRKLMKVSGPTKELLVTRMWDTRSMDRVAGTVPDRRLLDSRICRSPAARGATRYQTQQSYSLTAPSCAGTAAGRRWMAARPRHSHRGLVHPEACAAHDIRAYISARHSIRVHRTRHALNGRGLNGWESADQSVVLHGEHCQCRPI